MAIELIHKLSANDQVRITGDDAKDVIKQAAFWAALPTVCPVCEAPVHLSFKHPQGYEYYGLECEGRPKHESNFGILKDKEMGAGLFYKGADSWESWQPRTDSYPDPDPYDQPRRPGPGSPPPGAAQPAQQGVPERPVYNCTECPAVINKAAAEASWKAYGKQLCPQCMAKAAERRKTGRGSLPGKPLEVWCEL